MYSKEEKVKRYHEMHTERLRKEAIAQARKAKALSHLLSEGQSVKEVSLELHEAGKLKKELDNTLELLMKEKAQTEITKIVLSSRPTSTESVTIAGSQPSVDVNHAAAVSSSSSTLAAPVTVSTAPAALPAGWQVVVDKASGKNYYWNKSTKVTTWTRPIAPATMAVLTSPVQPVLWKEVVHPATQQVYFVHSDTGEERWSKPDDLCQDDCSLKAKPVTAANSIASAPLLTTGNESSVESVSTSRVNLKFSHCDNRGSEGPSAKKAKN